MPPDVIDTQTFIAMRHPETDGVAAVAISSYNVAHRPKGWQRVTAENSTVEQLIEAAEILNKDVAFLGDKPTKGALSDVLNPDLAAPAAPDKKG